MVAGDFQRQFPCHAKCTNRKRWLSLAALAGRTDLESNPQIDAELFHSAPQASYQGIEFLEFATDAKDARRLGEALQPLGFAQAGEHRSKDVSLWRNGGVNVILNHESHSWADEFHRRHGVSLCAMAWRVKGAANVLQRAQDYGYPIWHEKHGPDERALAAVCAPTAA